MVVQEDWGKIRRREKYIIKEIDPIKLLRVLGDNVLTQIDCESITATCNNSGPIIATQQELLVRLKKRGPDAFSKFVAALHETGQSHAAQLLDPKFKVVPTVSGRRDDRVFEPGVAADIRVKICLPDVAVEHYEQFKEFGEKFKMSHSEATIELRKHFNDFLDENIRRYVNLVKTTFSDNNPLILIFRLSDLEAANTFWTEFNEGDLKLGVRNKLKSFSDDKNCFKNEDIPFDIAIDEDDFQKVHHTLGNLDECKVLVDGMEKQELSLRDYQRELVQPALDGKNTIICAPTGSGKTFVAMEAIKHHVTHPDRKYVAFIVNTVSLVEQQESCLQRYLPESVEVSSLCGRNPDISLSSVLEDNQVVVLTAQVLLNALKKDKPAGEAGVAQEKEITISQFSLLVFDECHHTNKEHPYNEIMRWYMRTKFEDPSSGLPQIIGLSASLGIGTGNSGSWYRAEDYIMGLCANLDVHELQVYAEEHNNETTITPISRDRANIFQKTIAGIMTEIEENMSRVGRCPHVHGSQPYENWVVSLRKENLGRDILTCLEHLNDYNTALMIDQEIRSEDALKYLLANLPPNDSTGMEIKLQNLFHKAIAAIQNGDPEPNPGLEKLEERLCEKLSCDAHSKGIIFVRTRIVADALVDWLKNSVALKDLVKNPTSVIGCGQRNGKVGMAKAKQDTEIKNFRDGDCNVIVATSVLLEGIDIPKCNFAINYGMPGNEITLMQARGRVRANIPGDWQYDIIVQREQVMIKERDLHKEKLMKETIKKVEMKDAEDFKKQVEKRQKRGYDDYVKNLSKQNSNPNALVPDDMVFHCQKCDKIACKASDIKVFHGTSRIVPNFEKNLQNAKFKEADSKYMPGGFNKTGKTYCNNCGQDWGNRAKNEFGEFPLMKISSFRVKSQGKSKIYSKWKDFPYELEEFKPEDHVD